VWEGQGEQQTEKTPESGQVYVKPRKREDSDKNISGSRIFLFNRRLKQRMRTKLRRYFSAAKFVLSQLILTAR
jgi:hypothetical protein